MATPGPAAASRGVSALRSPAVESATATRSVASAPSGSAEPRPTRSPLWATLSFSFLASIGTGVVTNGIFFLTQQAYRFTARENYWLGLLLGVTYVISALGAGPLLRRLGRNGRGLSTRGALVTVMVLAGAVCMLPLVARGMAAPSTGDLPRWPVWVLVAVYSPLTGVIWPVVESFVSGGRGGASLRSAIGRFNVTWSSAIVLAYWAIAPLMKDHAVELLAGLGSLHILSIALVVPFGANPAPHEPESHEPHPPVYRRLLATHRVLLPTSYVVLTALTPYLPSAMQKLNLPEVWYAPAAATWLAARVVVFFVMERWHGWHGRWYLPVCGGLLLMGGFALAVLAPAAHSVAMLLAGLWIFGTGMASIYAAALYYAMEVGAAEVDAGGMHEGLIGVGYSIGPVCGLVAWQVVGSGGADRVDVAVLTTVSVVALLATGYAVDRAWRAGRA